MKILIEGFYYIYQGTYDQAKTVLFLPLFGDGFLSHVCASGIAGVTSACVSTPVDVVKTRLMNEAGSAPAERKYRGILHCFTKTVSEEGVGALYKGFTPICVRKVIWCAAFFVSYEFIRKQIGGGIMS